MDVYRLNFHLMQFYNYSLVDIENMLPWERDIYVTLVRAFVDEENAKIRQSQS